jgi:hypothetical protein
VSCGNVLGVSRHSITEIFDHPIVDKAIALNSPIVECILASDQIHQWGAAFIFSVDDAGEWHAECLRAKRQMDGRWADIGRSGTSGPGWPIPWSPPAQGWKDDPLMVLTSGGQSVDTATAQDQMLAAVVGFADPSVEVIRMVQGDSHRQITIRSKVGAFVVMSIGVGPIELQALNSDRMKIGSTGRIL